MGYPTDADFEESHRRRQPPAHESGHTCWRTDSEHWDLRSAGKCPQCRKKALEAGRTDEEIEEHENQFKKMMQAVTGETTVQSAIDVLKVLSEEDRLTVFRAFCIHCGCVQPEHGRPCQCWNDE